MFANDILRRDSEKHGAAGHAQDWVVYDRGAVEAIAGVHALAPFTPTELRTRLQAFKVDRVFILAPWPEIYTTDDERDQSAADAERIHRSVDAWYRQAGYDPLPVPRASPADRAAWVLRALGIA